MTDITLCKQEDCIDKNRCYRYHAAVNPYRQSYFATDPRKGKISIGECLWLIEISPKKRDQLIRINKEIQEEYDRHQNDDF